MGLDSVELIIDFEKYFNIEIPDEVAEKIETIQMALNGISEILNISDENTFLKDSIFLKLKNIISKEFDLKDNVFDLIITEDISHIAKKLDLEIPDIKTGEKFQLIKPVMQKIFGYDYKKITFEDFILAICSKNYTKLINPKTIKSKYEILVAISAITVDKCGVDYYEIKLEKSFVNDFGIS